MAVSGGVDSMALLHVLSRMPELDLIVAHYDHGIRFDSGDDRALAAQAAHDYKLPFVYAEGKLGASTSEAEARTHRYGFLRKVMQEHDARAIITAHHQDDLLETMLLNMLRGTHRRGLTSLRSTEEIIRPLLDIPKQDLVAYARKHQLEWREDSTNADPRYRRNHIRQQLMPKLTPLRREALLRLHKQMRKTNLAIDAEIAAFPQLYGDLNTLDRYQFIMLPHAVAREVMADYLRSHKAEDVDRINLEVLVARAKTARPRTLHDVDKQLILEVGQRSLKIVPRLHRKSS